MGIGAIALGIAAWILVFIGFGLKAPHEATSLALVIAISGAAVAHEGRLVEANTSATQKRVGFWINLAAATVAAIMIAWEILRRTGG
jgi:hypothetical protein